MTMSLSGENNFQSTTVSESNSRTNIELFERLEGFLFLIKVAHYGKIPPF
jgi:hypothetical protein